MAVDEVVFDEGMNKFLSEVHGALADIRAKLEEAGSDIDISEEMDRIQNANHAFDDMRAHITGIEGGENGET